MKTSIEFAFAIGEKVKHSGMGFCGEVVGLFADRAGTKWVSVQYLRTDKVQTEYFAQSELTSDDARPKT